MKQTVSASVRLHYRGVTPIATCHWQWVGNILADWGVANAWETLGLSWGCRWMGGSVLFGLATWPALLREISGAEVEIHTFQGPADARSTELRLSHADVPFIAEIDAYHIPAAHRERTHVVHVVLVIERDEKRALIVDSTIGPEVIERSAAEYELMRASPCLGRVEGHKLYAVMRSSRSNPEPAAILHAVRRHLDATFPESLRVLERYIEWVEGSGEPIDVCRAAGERFQATRLFRYLAKQNVVGAARLAMLLDQLTSDWYLVYMLATHERGVHERARRRIVRLLKQLAINEVMVAEAVLG